MSDQLNFGKDSIYKEGYGIVAKLVMRNKELSPEAKAIYSYICSFAGSGTTAFPSAELMMHELNLGDNRFYKYRKELVDKGYITIIKQRNGSRREKNIYQIEVEPSKVIEHRQNKGIEDEHRQNESLQNESVQNDGSNINSIINNNLNSNSNNIIIINKDEENKSEDDDRFKKLSEKCKQKNINLNVYQIKTLMDLYDNTQVLRAIEKAFMSKANIKNPYGYISTTIENATRVNNTTVNVNKSEKGLGFNNFEQRQYDYDDLEKKLLGWD